AARSKRPDVCPRAALPPTAPPRARHARPARHGERLPLRRLRGQRRARRDGGRRAPRRRRERDRPRPRRWAEPRDLRREGRPRARMTAAWRSRLGGGASIDVPERGVDDAERALLVQALTLGWRYSSGNAYEEFSYPESLDVAGVMAGWGYADVARTIVQTSFT